jgi:hypothetical protein
MSNEDGVVDLGSSDPSGENVMADTVSRASSIDVPTNFAGHAMAESLTNAQLANAQTRNLALLAVGVIGAASARNFDELGTVEGKTAAGVLATDVGGPTNAGK